MFNTFFSFMLPEYEKNCLSEYANGNTANYIFDQSGNEKFNETVTNCKDFTKRQEFNKFLDVIRLEQTEIDAFNQCYKKREEYE